MSKSKQLYEKIVLECYKELYNAASPRANTDALIYTGISEREFFFDKYYLSNERQKEILDRIYKKYKLTKWEKQSFNWTILLGAAPRSIKRVWYKQWYLWLIGWMWNLHSSIRYDVEDPVAEGCRAGTRVPD